MNTWFKNNINTCLKNCIALIAVLLLAVPARANHIVGLDLFYTWISGNTYKVTLVAYGDCGSATTSSAFGSLPSATPEICVFNGDTQIGFITLAIEAPSAGVEITPVCPTDLALTQCTDVSYAIPGIKKFVYSGTYTLPYASATWRFIFSGNLGAGTVAGRALSITNLSTANSITQLADTLNNLTVHNSNPNFTVIPTPFFCLSNANNYNPGAVDADGDSLAFFLVPGSGLTGPTSCDLAPGASYVWPATATAPLGATSFSFDNHTGQISFIPNVLQRSLVVYNIEEYRGGQKIGTCQREMTFIVLTCTDIAPTAGLIGASSGTIDDSIHYHVCQNSGPFSLQLQASEPVSTNNIWVAASGMPSGCTFSTLGNGTPHPLSTIAWTSTGVTPGTYTIYVTYTDDNCPLTGTRTLAYSLTIVASPSLTYTQLAAATCTGKAYVSLTPAGLGAPWHVAISDPAGDTIQTFSGVTGTIYDSLASGNYTVTLSPSSASFCTSATAISVAYPPGFNITTALTNPTYCGSNDGTITISGFTPGSSDSVRYHFNGVLQPAVYTTASAAGTITLTGLYAGTMPFTAIVCQTQ